MPLYETKCDDCGRKSPIWRRVADRDSLPNCDVCDGILERVISAPYIAPDITPYISPASGKIINSKAQIADDLERTGYILKEPGLDKDVARWGAEKKAKDFVPVEKGIDACVNNLVNRGLIES